MEKLEASFHDKKQLQVASFWPKGSPNTWFVCIGDVPQCKTPQQQTRHLENDKFIFPYLCFLASKIKLFEWSYRI
jgi:hypothetical protein